MYIVRSFDFLCTFQDGFSGPDEGEGDGDGDGAAPGEEEDEYWSVLPPAVCIPCHSA